MLAILGNAIWITYLTEAWQIMVPAANSHQQPAASAVSCDTRGLEFEAPLGRQSHGVLVCGHWLHRPLAMLDGQ
jgi:hypothetical protein